MADVLRARAEHQPDQVAYRFLGDGEQVTTTLTYRELDVLAQMVAGMLSEVGGTQQRVILAHTPGLDFIVDLMGCLYAGMVAVPVYPPIGHRETTTANAVIRASRPAAVLSDQSTIASALAEVASIAALTPADRGTRRVGQWYPPECGRESLAVLQFTSGSTGAPRGVRVQHRNLLANQARMRTAYGQNSDSVVVSWLPFYHDMGLIGSVLHTLYLGATCVLMSPLSFLQAPIRWLRAITEFGGTISPAPDFAYALCARRISDDEAASLDLRTWHVAINGGEPVRADTVRSFSERFRPAGFDPRAMVASYGLAEATLLVAADDPRREPQMLRGADGRELVSCGPVPDGVVVVDAEGHPVRPGEVGEICVAGEDVADGYWDQPDVSAETFGGLIAGTRHLRTGDLGFVSGGELFISGRTKDVLVIRGRNHYPQDMEATAEAAAPRIRPGCTAAFLDGERVVVVAETRDDIADPGILAAVRAALSGRHGVASEVVLIARNTIPKTSSGKVRRRACREAYECGQLQVLGSVGACDADVRRGADIGARRRPRDDVDRVQHHGVGTGLPAGGDVAARTGASAGHRNVHSNNCLTTPRWQIWRRQPGRTGSHHTRKKHQKGSPRPSDNRPCGCFISSTRLAFDTRSPRAFRIGGDLDVAALRQALREVAGRHPALRSRVVVDDGHDLVRLRRACPRADRHRGRRSGCIRLHVGDRARRPHCRTARAVRVDPARPGRTGATDDRAPHCRRPVVDVAAGHRAA